MSSEYLVEPRVTGVTETPPQGGQPSCLETIELWGAGFALPGFSPSFHYHAIRQRVIGAIGFLVLFGMLLSILQSIAVGRVLYSVGQDIREAFTRGTMPEITISQGIAEVDAPQPYVLVDEGRMLVVFDTTGQYTEIDRRRYDQGVLLTRTELIFLNNDGSYQEISLRDLNMLLETDPIRIDASTAATAWGSFSVTAVVIVILALAIWHTVIRLAYLALIALIVWGIAALIRPGISFGPVLITGIYAIVPAWFLRFLLRQVEIRLFGLFGLFTLFLLIFWGIGLVLAFLSRTEGDKPPSSLGSLFRSVRPLRGWRVLIALPLMIDVGLEIIFNWDAWQVTWPLAFLTLAALLVVGLWPLIVSGGRPADSIGLDM